MNLCESSRTRPHTPHTQQENSERVPPAPPYHHHRRRHRVQVHLLGTAAAMELGLDMEIYNAFNLLDTDEAAEGEDSAGATPGGRGGSGGGGGSGMMRDSSLGSMAAGASSGGAPLHSAQGMQGGGLDGMLGDDDMLAEVKLEWDPSDSMNMDAQ